MGRTKRLRQRKRRDVTPNKSPLAIGLFNYMSQFGWNNHNKLICQDFAITGRGLCSKSGLSKGDVLIKLPLEAMITLGTLENDYDFRNDCGLLSSNAVTFQSLLALYVLYRSHMDNNKPSLKLYLESIPKTFSTPYFCQSNELYFLPEIILKQTVEQNKKIRDSYNAFKIAFGTKTCKCCGQSFMLNIFTFCSYKWAYFAVNSRSVYLSAREIKSLINGDSYFQKCLSDDPDMALAPFLDMFNHSGSVITAPQVVKENNNLIFQLLVNDSCEPYEQIFISYGNFTNAKLFAEYGFSLEQNLHDYFEISLADIEALIKSDRTLKGIFFHSNKFKFIRDHNLNDQMFIHTVDGLSHNLQVTLYLIFIETSHFSNVLNQTAFGSNIIFENYVQTEAKLLALFKIKEYQSFIDGFLKLKDLSASGQASIDYLRHSVFYLQSYLDNLS